MVSIISPNKKLRYACLLALAIVACAKEDDSSTDQTTISEEEAVEAMAVAVVPEQNGLVAQLEQTLLTFADTVEADCEVSYDTTFTQSLQKGSNSYNYSLEADWICHCNLKGNTKDFEINYSLLGQSDSPRMSSQDSTSGTLKVAGISASAFYTFNGSYSRGGTQTSKLGRQSSFSSQLNMVIDSVQVDKLNQEIASGNITFSLSGTSLKGQSFNYGGSLLFNGNSNAVLTLDNGNMHQLSW